MLTKNYVSALLAAIAVYANALATDSVAPNSEQMVELSREAAQYHNGFLVYFGYPSEQQDPGHTPNETQPPQNSTGHSPTPLARSTCKNPTLKCSTSHTARNDVCDSLAVELTSNPNVPVSKSPRQICYEGEDADKNQYCCVSWSTPIKGLIKGDLLPAVNKISTHCTANGISGLIRSDHIRKTCVTVCLSNRGTHCG